ncbi:LysR family transcriptional regulator [Variovorax sp. J31P207]|uniref:LysR family transcriptional regulator n=1 Tax=Variovorax sp. J31P207 TaxID=3053510 RepID=UPI002574FC8F|nr:LysR family transcriptional regulator [Variovorax sp. J31P207]MDM0071654.1 LysR family transcriptional regulator [Variovorax sp. J31P207]
MDSYTQLLAFVWVIESGNFSAAARAHDLSPSTISKLITALERRLAVRLFVRGAQTLTLTEEGVAFEGSARAVTEAMAAADSLAEALPQRVSGVLRIHTMTTFAKHQILPWLPEFLVANPDLAVEIEVGAQFVDRFDQGVDVAIHSGILPDSSRVARRIGESEWLVCASPAYLLKYGEPKTPEDLLQHRCFNFSFASPWNSWSFRRADEIVTVPVQCRASFTQGDLLRDLALAGEGVVRLADFHIGADIATGALVPLLQAFRLKLREPVYLIHAHREHVSPKVRAFQMFIEARIARQGWAA